MKVSLTAKAISFAGILLALTSLWLGAILPLRKGGNYIEAQRAMSGVRSVEELKSNFEVAFNTPTPIGDEELAKFLAGNFLTIIQSGQQSHEVAKELVAYAESKLFPDETRHLLLRAQLRQALWQNYELEEDYLAAIEAYESAHALGPELPTPLYGLFGLYAAAGNVERAEVIGGQILEKWPEDQKVLSALQSIK